MTAPSHLSAAVAAVWSEIVARQPDAAESPIELEAYAALVATLRRHVARIEAEGDFPVNAKGEPAPHPSLDIVRRTSAELRSWRGRFP